MRKPVGPAVARSAIERQRRRCCARYSTSVVTTVAGYEKRNANWAAARGRWNVAQGLKTREQVANLIAFFRARKGRAHGFRFKDWTDFQALAQVLGTGDGVAKTFALVKHYASGGITETRTTTKPVAGTVKIYVTARRRRRAGASIRRRGW